MPLIHCVFGDTPTLSTCFLTLQSSRHSLMMNITRSQGSLAFQVCETTTDLKIHLNP